MSMHIFLYGPSGSGKSTAGKILSANLGLTFLDLDAEVEREARQKIPEVMASGGEAAFRDLETAMLRSSLTSPDTVIALGGGALLREENRSLAERSGKVVLLHADLATLLKRLAHDGVERPLLSGKPEEKLPALLERRAEHYASFPLRVDASGTPQQVAWELQRSIGRFHLRGMHTGYDVLVEEGGLDHLGGRMYSRRLDGPVLVVSDANVAPLYGERAQASLKEAGYSSSQMVFPAGEGSKNLDTIRDLWRGCLEAGLDRKSTVLALGGGVVSDLAGFAAGTFMRGCRWVVVPTTLLAMVDASLGGKTGFDLPEGKNLVGAFYPPGLVLADPEMLATLPERELRSGLAEVVKHGVIADPELFDLCAQGWEAILARLPEITRRAMAVKVKVIEEDPYEQGVRATLNLGHTIGHALELASDFRLAHGEAVAIGMVTEARLAERLDLAKPGLSKTLAQALSALGLPIEIPGDLSRDRLIQVMKMDKKRSTGTVRFALPVKIGEVRSGVEIPNLEEAL